MKRHSTSDEQFTEIVKTSFSIRDVLKKLNLALAGGSYKSFYSRCKSLNLDTSHFTGQGHLKGKTHKWNTKYNLKDILVVNSKFSNSNFLRKRLIKEGLLENKCNQCNITNWQGKELTLHLDHINGINTDNSITNLRLLCPNCHSQTSTYTGRNKRKKKNYHLLEIKL